jgi:hypothetical protein
MKTRAKLAAMLPLLMSMSSAFATVRIYDDRGGQIGEYLSKFHALRVSGEQAVGIGRDVSHLSLTALQN